MTDDKPPAELPRRRLIELSIGIGAAAALAAAAPPQNGREAQGLRRQEDTMAGQTIRKHHPVAVVYYLYDPNSPKQPIGASTMFIMELQSTKYQ
jgi:hypothetical protein